MGAVMNWCLRLVAAIIICSSKCSAQLTEFYLSEVRLPELFSNLTAECINDVIAVSKGIQNADVGSLKFLDSWGKPSSGVLQGNLNQFGDFDECIKIKIKRQEKVISGKYCLLNFDVRVSSDEFNNLIHSHFFIKNNFNDPTHRIPHMSTFSWGACIPSSCTANDLEEILKGITRVVPLRNTSVEFQAKDDLCTTNERQSTTMPSGVKTALVLGFVTFVVFVWRNGKSRGLKRAVTCFSLRRNLKELFDVNSEEGLMELNGIRALSSLSLFLAHKQMSLLYKPYMNRTSMVEFIGLPWSVIGRTAILHTDTFLLVSGFLTFKGFLKEQALHGTVNVKKSIISRYLRLAPSLLAVIVVSAWVLPDLNSGPLWNSVIRSNSALCKENWWRNMLFIQNYFGFEYMCLTNTHQLGIDFQLFLVSVLLILLMKKTQWIGLIIFMMSLISTALRILITLKENLSVLIYFGIPVSQLFTSANKSYILPSHRLTVYLFGVSLAIFLHRHPNCRFQKKHFAVGWAVAIICGLLPLFGPYHLGQGYVYNNVEAALYNGFSSISWGFFVAWTILACVYGEAGWFGKILSWKWLRVYSKLSYSIYLIQFPVFFYNIGIKRDVDSYSINELFNLPEFSAIVLLSLALTLFIEMPFNNLRDSLLKNSKKSSGGIKEQPPTFSKREALRNEQRG